MEQRYLRVLYALEFIATLLAVYTVWGQVGGQGHLDQMDWRWKLGLGVGLAYASVKATAAAAAGERAWNVRTLRWMSIVLALAAAAAFVTYYYHLYEPLEEEEGVAGAEPVKLWLGGYIGRQPGESAAHAQLARTARKLDDQLPVGRAAALAAIVVAAQSQTKAREANARPGGRPVELIGASHGRLVSRLRQRHGFSMKDAARTQITDQFHSSPPAHQDALRFQAAGLPLEIAPPCMDAVSGHRPLQVDGSSAIDTALSQAALQSGQRNLYAVAGGVRLHAFKVDAAEGKSTEGDRTLRAQLRQPLGHAPAANA
jgi:hypothetical protein